MKKLIIFLLLLSTILIGCTKTDTFRSEYINIEDTNHVFKEVNLRKLEDSFKSGTHLIYFGFPECPWCQQYVYYFNEFAKEKGVNEILYFNHKSIRNYEVTNSGIILNNDYLKLINLLQEQNMDKKKVVKFLSQDGLEITDFTNVDEKDIELIPWLYAPTLYLIKDGKVIGNKVSTIQGHKIVNNELPLLTNDQQLELKNKVNELLDLYK